jgi:hypothetical protein
LTRNSVQNDDIGIEFTNANSSDEEIVQLSKSNNDKSLEVFVMDDSETINIDDI